MGTDSFSNFDIGIIILVVTLVVGFFIYMILRLMEIFSSSRDLKLEREKMEIEIMKAQKDYIQKTKDKKKKTEDPKSQEIDKQDQNIEKLASEENLKKDNELTTEDNTEDDFSDIDKDNIVKF
jgi:hypothetical protein